MSSFGIETAIASGNFNNAELHLWAGELEASIPNGFGPSSRAAHSAGCTAGCAMATRGAPGWASPMVYGVTPRAGSSADFMGTPGLLRRGNFRVYLLDSSNERF